MNKIAAIFVAAGIGVIGFIGVWVLMPGDGTTRQVEAEWRFTIAEWKHRYKLVCAQAECNAQRCRKQGGDATKCEHELMRVKAIMDAQRERIHTLSEPHIVK